MLELWKKLAADADKPTILPMSESGLEFAKELAASVGMVPIKRPRLGGPVFRKKRKTDK